MVRNHIIKNLIGSLKIIFVILLSFDKSKKDVTFLKNVFNFTDNNPKRIALAYFSIDINKGIITTVMNKRTSKIRDDVIPNQSKRPS